MHRLLPSLLLLASFSVAQAESLLSGDWKIVSVAGIERVDTEKTEFHFLPERRLAATLGCNRLIGGAEIAGEAIKLGPVATTQMACPPPLDRDEPVFAAALEKIRRFAFDGASLTLRDEAGQVLVTLRRGN